MISILSGEMVLVGNLKHVKMMEEAGFDEDQWKAIVRIWSDIVELNLATKDDMLLLKKDFLLMKKDLEMAFVDHEKKLDKLEGRLLVKLAGIQFIYAGFILGVVKYVIL